MVTLRGTGIGSNCSLGDCSRVAYPHGAVEFQLTGGGRRRQLAGFSLVEVVIALAVMASSFLVVFGLLGVGLNTFHQSKGISVSAQIAQQVFSQLQNIQFSNLTGTNGSLTARSTSPLTSPQYSNTITSSNSSSGATSTTSTLYFDEQGNQLNAQTGSVYWVNVRVAYPTPIPPYSLASGNFPSGSLDADLATVLVQVIYNPGGVTPAADSTTAWTGVSSTGAVLQLYNYQFFVARNS